MSSGLDTVSAWGTVCAWETSTSAMGDEVFATFLWRH